MKDGAENFTEHSAAAEDARFHGSYGNFQDFGDLFVRKPLEISQNHGAAERGGNSGKGAADGGLHFVRGTLLEGRRFQVLQVQGLVARGLFGVDRNLISVMPPEPAAVVERLAHGDPVEPRLERASAAESADAPESVNEHFLCDVGCFGWVG